jgi:hypothetical protein
VGATGGARIIDAFGAYLLGDIDAKSRRLAPAHAPATDGGARPHGGNAACSQARHGEKVSRLAPDRHTGQPPRDVISYIYARGSHPGALSQTGQPTGTAP